MRPHAVASLIVLAVALTACRSGGISHSVVALDTSPYPPHEGPVTVSFSREPEGSTPVAIVQVYDGQAGAIKVLVPEIARIAATLGADRLKVDVVKTRFEKSEETKTETYECGSKEEPKKCSDTRTETVQRFTTQLVGRAFRTVR